jgi:pimeloyl-ACP methyl ester carboxylesterase
LAIGLLTTFFRAGIPKDGHGGAWWYPHAFAAYYRMVLPNAPDRRTAIIAAGRDHAAVLSQAWDSFRQPQADLRPKLMQLNVPIHFAWAMSDQLVSYARSKRAIALAIARGRATLSKFRGGHAPFLEDLDRFASDFRDFVQRVTNAPTSPIANL